MRKLFLRIYLLIIIIVVVVGAAADSLFRRGVVPAQNEALEAMLEPALRNVAAAVSATPPGSAARDDVIARAAADANPSLALVPLSALALDDDERAHLEGGHVVVRGDIRVRRAWLRVPGEDLVVEHELIGFASMMSQWLAPAVSGEAARETLARAGAVPVDESQLSPAERARLRYRPIGGAEEDRFADVHVRLPSGEVVLARDVVTGGQAMLRWLFPLAALLLVGVGLALKVLPLQRQLEAIERATKAFGSGRLSARAGNIGNGPLADLASRFDDAASRVEKAVLNREELLRAVSHELRTPAARLLFALDLLRTTDSADKRERLLDEAERAVEDVRTLSTELLEFARLDESGPALARSECRVLELVRATVDAEVLAHGGARKPEVVGAEVTCNAEPRLVARAIGNLVRNALRHCDGRVVVTVERVGEGVAVHVDDDGPGVPADQREAVLEPFRRLDDSRTRSTGGAGLGLAVAHRVAERHGGKLAISESAALGGARFTLSLPKAR